MDAMFGAIFFINALASVCKYFASKLLIIVFLVNILLYIVD